MSNTDTRFRTAEWAMLTGHKLKALRALSGMTQASLAEASEVSATAIAEFEAGRRDLRVSTVRKLLEALGVKVVFQRKDGTQISG